MNLRRRSNGVWMLEVTIGGRRIRKSTGERDKAAAGERARVILAELNRDAGLCDWTLSMALQDCYDRVWVEQKSAAHTHKRIGKLERDYPALVAANLTDLKFKLLEDVTDTMAERGAKPATINRYLALISKACNEAVRRDKLERAQVPMMPYRKEPKGKLRWLTRAEERALRVKAEELWPSLDAARMQALIVVLVDTGARLSEILKTGKMSGLTQITLTDTKNGQSRSVPLTERAARALCVVPNWTADQATGRFTRLRDACNLPDVTLHTLRHTCASRLVQGGMDLYRVQTWLGHANIGVTQRYAHLSPSNLTAGVDILSAVD